MANESTEFCASPAEEAKQKVIVWATKSKALSQIIPIAITPNIYPRIVYISTLPLPQIANRIELVMRGNEVQSFKTFLENLVPRYKENAINLPDEILQLTDYVINTESNLYLTIPVNYDTWKVTVFSSDVGLRDSLPNECQYSMRVCYGREDVVVKSKVLDSLVLAYRISNWDSSTFLTLSSIPGIFRYNGVVDCYTNGIKADSPCFLCPHYKPGVTKCMWYTTNYECAFTKTLNLDISKTPSEDLSILASLSNFLGVDGPEVINDINEAHDYWNTSDIYDFDGLDLLDGTRFEYAVDWDKVDDTDDRSTETNEHQER